MKTSTLSYKIRQYMIFAGLTTFVFSAVVIILFFYGLYLTLTSWDGVSRSKPFVGIANYISAFSFQGEKSYDYMAKLPVKEFMGKELILKGDFPKTFFEGITTFDRTSYKEEGKPFAHFTAKTGWINDPNGLIYDGEYYHLYFQYNPFNITWENMSWGHAVSKDLIHWEQKDSVLFPDENGMMFSGCGWLLLLGRV